MFFLEKIGEILGNPVGYRAYLTVKGVYLENVKRILCVSKTAIKAESDGCVIAVKGENLSVGALSDGDLLIRGRASSVELEK